FTSADTPQELDVLVRQLQQQRQLSVDTETTHLSPRLAEIVGYALAWQPGQGFYIRVRGPAGDRVLDPALVAVALRPVLEDPA
ncbi:MAG TPA: hypothetical protein PKC18_19305, partial [Lacipirellulaceae bacterium]|nr:hypothetical protein [Lacipirellulaceae bacterium]